jgi:hypothetical protein
MASNFIYGSHHERIKQLAAAILCDKGFGRALPVQLVHAMVLMCEIDVPDRLVAQRLAPGYRLA